jgi:hypothetical protein
MWVPMHENPLPNPPNPSLNPEPSRRFKRKHTAISLKPPLELGRMHKPKYHMADSRIKPQTAMRSQHSGLPFKAYISTISSSLPINVYGRHLLLCDSISWLRRFPAPPSVFSCTQIAAVQVTSCFRSSNRLCHEGCYVLCTTQLTGNACCALAARPRPKRYHPGIALPARRSEDPSILRAIPPPQPGARPGSPYRKPEVALDYSFFFLSSNTASLSPSAFPFYKNQNSRHRDHGQRKDDRCFV